MSFLLDFITRKDARHKTETIYLHLSDFLIDSDTYCTYNLGAELGSLRVDQLDCNVASGL